MARTAVFESGKWSQSLWYATVYGILSRGQEDKTWTLAQRRREMKRAAQFFLDEEDNLWFRGRDGLQQCVVESEVAAAVHEHHDGVCGGHYGRDHTLLRLRQSAYWPSMYGDVDRYVKSCDSCQRFGAVVKKNPLHPYAPLAPFQLLFVDWVTGLPETAKGNRNLVVAYEPLTHWEEAMAFDRATAKNSTIFLWKSVCTRFSIPSVIITDNGSHFRGEFSELCTKLGIRHHHVSPYRPQGNLVERSNGNIMARIKRWIVQHPLQWDQLLDEALWACRSRIIPKYGLSPMQMLFAFTNHMKSFPST